MESLGEYLKKERESRNVSLEDMSKKTRINIKILEAFEKDDKKNMPGETFSRGFLRAYAHFIGLDEADVLLKYDHFYKSDEQPPEEYKIEVIDDMDKSKSKKFIISLIVIIILTGLVFAVYNSKKSVIKKYYRLLIKKEPEVKPKKAAPEKKAAETKIEAAEVKKEAPEEAAAVKEPEKEPEVKPIKAAPEKKAAETKIEAAEVKKEAPEERTEAIKEKKEDKTKTQVSEEKPKEEGHDIVFRADDMVWMRIQVDENEPYEVILRSGEIYKKSAEKRFKLKIGNAGKLKITFDGRELGYLGKDKEVKEATLPGKQ